MVRLTFRPLQGDTSVLARGAYFRICEDSTLRGPDNMVTAVYVDRFWRLGQRRFRGFECEGPIYLRVKKGTGVSEQSGPYEFVRAADGALYTHESCLGSYAPVWKGERPEDRWCEIVLLSAAAS